MKSLLLVLAVVLVGGCGKKNKWPEFKTCERCKETDIKFWADVCKHCGKDPDGANGPEERAELMEIWLEEQRAENDTKPLSTNPIIEKAIRKELKKPEGELTAVDLDKVWMLNLISNELTEVPKGLEKLTQLEWLGLGGNQLTNVKGLENLTQLKELYLGGNPDLTKAQIDELKKALPNCIIRSDFE